MNRQTAPTQRAFFPFAFLGVLTLLEVVVALIGEQTGLIAAVVLSFCQLPILLAALYLELPQSVCIGFVWGIFRMRHILGQAALSDNALAAVLAAWGPPLLLAVLAVSCFRGHRDNLKHRAGWIAAMSIASGAIFALAEYFLPRWMLSSAPTPAAEWDVLLLAAALSGGVLLIVDRFFHSRQFRYIRQLLRVSGKDWFSSFERKKVLPYFICLVAIFGLPVLYYVVNVQQQYTALGLWLPAEARESLVALSVQFILMMCCAAVCLFAGFTAISWLLADAQRRAQLDEMTGVRHNRAAKQEIESRLSATKGEGGTLMILDVDDFKLVNDTYGHPFGDMTLSQIAGILQSSVRENDVIGRLGGDEFCIFLSGDYNRESVAELVESIRKRVNEISAPGQPSGGITCSIGVAVSRRRECLDSLYRQADEALYAAKGTGKNTCCFYQDFASL